MSNEWRFDVEEMPRQIGAKVIEIAYVSTQNKPSTAIVHWDGMRWITARCFDTGTSMCPPDTIYAWKLASPPPPIPERAHLSAAKKTTDDI